MHWIKSTCKPNIYVSWSTFELRVWWAPWYPFKPSSKIFYWQFQGGISFVDHLWYLCLVMLSRLWYRLKPSSKIFLQFQGGISFVDHLCYLCLVMLSRLFIVALWSPAGKGLTSWLLFVMFNCVLSLSHVLSWVWCGTWLYRFLIFATFLTLSWPSGFREDRLKMLTGDWRMDGR